MTPLIKLKNGKFSIGNYNEPNAYKGWFVGAFMENSEPCKTDKVEILYKEHNAGDKVPGHYHKQKVELLLMLEGKAKYRINGNEVLLEQGKYLFVDCNNIIEGEFLERSKIFALHAPSIPEDKFLVNK